MFSTNIVNEKTEKNKQINCLLNFLISKTYKFTVKSNSRNTDWIVDLLIPTSKVDRLSTWQKLISDRAHFPIYLENSIKNISNVYETFINT